MVVYVVLLFLSLLAIVVGHNVDILNPIKRCIATSTQIGNCHVCMCKTDGVFHCRGIKCDMYKTRSGKHDLSKSASDSFHSLPEISEGEPCVPDQLYKMDCNRCRCTKDKTLMCTKMACFDWNKFKSPAGKKALRDDDNGEKTYLPQMQTGMSCKPGKLYRSKCKRCFCSVDNKLLCSKKLKDACTFDKYGNPPPIQKPEDIHPTSNLSDDIDIPTLPTASEQCSPGKSYKVDCNFCLCLDSGNLLCQKKLCLSYDDMNRIEAKDLSGKPCSPETIMSHTCKACKCVDGKTLCSAVIGCYDKPDIQLLLGKDEPTEELDPDTDWQKCLPRTIYKTDCNKCYCQEDGSLRCTQKTCLNYSQVKLLEEQRQYIEQHGL